jgi:hypothetical protein
MRRQAAVLIAVLALLAVVAATPAGGQTGSKPVQVTLTEYRIQLSRSVVPRGRVTFQVVNRGTIAHDFTFVAAGRGTRALRPGQRQSFTARCACKGRFASGRGRRLRSGAARPRRRSG